MTRSKADETDVEGILPSTPAIPQDMKYEAALAELEQLVQEMESGRLSLEDSISAYQRGSELFKHCQQQLSEAERKIQILENGALRDFDPASGESS